MHKPIFKLLLPTLLVSGLALSVTAYSRPSPRQLVLEVREMAYYLPGDPTPNPTLQLRRGELIELRLVNRSPGLRHDWVADSLGVATRLLDGDGSSDVVALKAPAVAGRHPYVCSLHSVMMRGVVAVD